MNDKKKEWKENLAEEYNAAMQNDENDGAARETASQVSYSKLNLSVTECFAFRNGSVASFKRVLHSAQGSSQSRGCFKERMGCVDYCQSERNG